MKYRIFFAVFVVTIFMLVLMNPVVSAEVIQQERKFFIEADNIVDYTSELNIVNGTNSDYTNFVQLVSPFMQQTGVVGGFAGSFLPPTHFILGSQEPRSTENNNLVLSSFVKFQKKNLLSGASVSWWRCPYFYNQSVSESKDWNLKLSIYHVDMPRNVNYSFESCIAGENYPNIVPEDYAHPSLVFQRSFTDCGNIQDSFQYAIDNSFSIPVNDTLVNPELEFNDTALPSDPEYNPRAYYTQMDYSHTWFNVTAPIYPNESYMVIWDIESAPIVDYEEAGSFWITATDIGNDGFGRTLVSWNNRTINEIPIDLDSSVIFQIGMGAGITGTKLFYDDPNYRGLNTYFANQDFDTLASPFRLSSTFSAPLSPISGWIPYASGVEAYVFRDPEYESVKFYVNETGITDSDITGIGLTSLMQTTGETLKFDITMHGATYYVDNANNENEGIIESSSLRINMVYGSLEHSDITITKRTRIVQDSVGEPDGVIYDNFLEYSNGIGLVQQFPITNSTHSMPENFYLTIENDIGYTIVSMYNKLDAREPFFIRGFNTDSSGTSVHSIDLSVFISKTANIMDFYQLGSLHVITCNESLAVEIYKIAGVDRIENLGWTVDGGSTERGVSKVEYKYPDGFEGSSAQSNPTSTKAFSFTSTSFLTNTKEIYQEEIVGTSSETVFFKGFYKLIQDNTPMNTWGGVSYIDNSYIEYTITGKSSLGGSTIATDSVRGTAWDSSWHEICASITGTFPVIEIKITAYFQTTGNPFIQNYRQAYCDNIELEAIRIDTANKHVFNQKVDTGNWNATNYYSLMIPFKHLIQPDFAPICFLYFKASNGAILDTVMTKPTDFYQDFILKSIRTASLNHNAVEVTIHLINFGTDSYLFLQDKNSDFFLNDKYEYKYNHFERYSSSTIFEDETFFSPHYSFSETDGEWSNADSVFTTTYFYFVVVHFVKFNDNDPEIISIKFDEVAVQDFEVYRFTLSAFGNVYTAEEWLGYLELKNRPTFQDKIVDALANLMVWMLENTLLGVMLMAIGKFIYDAVIFLAPYIEALGNLILEAFVFIVSVMIYFIATWVMWNFTKFWIYVGQDRVEEGLAELTRFTSQVTRYAKSGVSAIGTVATKGKSLGK